MVLSPSNSNGAALVTPANWNPMAAVPTSCQRANARAITLCSCAVVTPGMARVLIE
jgi:hypothetical protein